ncbi:MAG: thioredoxin family protein [Cyclobacteriaceae bacterium]|nr:thioredoxin family protein [Cyclobacteriaceae bacterium]
MKAILAMFCMALLIAANTNKRGYEVGDTATDFKLKNVDGKMISLANYKEAKGFIVIFDCNTCPYSKAYNERIIALNKKYSNSGFPVIAINANDGSGDTFEDMIRLAKKKDYKFPYVFDQTQAIAKAYGATNTPHVFVLDKNLRVSYIGAIDDNPRKAQDVTKRYVEDAVDALLANKPISVTKTKAIGCGITWKRD